VDQSAQKNTTRWGKKRDMPFRPVRADPYMFQWDDSQTQLHLCLAAWKRISVTSSAAFGTSLANTVICRVWLRVPDTVAQYFSPQYPLTRARGMAVSESSQAPCQHISLIHSSSSKENTLERLWSVYFLSEALQSDWTATRGSFARAGSSHIIRSREERENDVSMAA
jgi:hypothetical protein